MIVASNTLPYAALMVTVRVESSDISLGEHRSNAVEIGREAERPGDAPRPLDG
jgi:hypothetical protein